MVEGRWSHAAPLRRVLDLIDAREEAGHVVVSGCI